MNKLICILVCDVTKTEDHDFWRHFERARKGVLKTTLLENRGRCWFAFKQILSISLRNISMITMMTLCVVCLCLWSFKLFFFIMHYKNHIPSPYSKVTWTLWIITSFTWVLDTSKLCFKHFSRFLKWLLWRFHDFYTQLLNFHVLIFVRVRHMISSHE